MILLGKTIKKLRNKHGYTQQDLAKLIGVTKSTVAAYENSTRLPSYKILIELSQIFNVSIDYLILNKKTTIIHTDDLSSEQVGALITLVKYFKHNRPKYVFYEDKPLDTNKEYYFN